MNLHTSPVRRPSAAESRTKKFTLIELLVVIAVIAILAGLLLPALNGARAKGISILCLSRVKQIGSADAQYQNDFGFYCPMNYGMGNKAAGKPNFAGLTDAADYERTDYTQEGFLTPYLKKSGADESVSSAAKTNLFFCPEPGYQAAWSAVPDNTITRGTYGGYGVNNNIHGRPSYETSGGEATSDTVRPAGRVKSPSRIASFGDCAGDARKTATTLAADSLADLFQISLNNITVHFRHRRSANILYADGHADTRLPAYLTGSPFRIGGLDIPDPAKETTPTESFDPDGYTRP